MKRLVRLQGEEIRSNLSKLSGIYVDYILDSGSVIHAVLVKQKGDVIVVKNAIQNKIEINLSQLSEVVYDKVS